MKKLKLITIILAIILITLVAFAGVYVKTQNRMENKVKEYKLGRILEGQRIIEIKVSDATSDDEEEIEAPDPEDLTGENYKIIKNTVENRLKSLGAEDYTISLNKENGTIRIELPEDDKTDTYAYYVTASGKVEITEKDEGIELLDENMIKKAKYSSVTSIDNEYQIYLELTLTKEGQAKIQEILNDYAILADEVEEIESATTEETSSDETTDTEETTENTDVTEEIEENSEETSNKKIAVLSIGGTDYDVYKIEKNKIRVKIGDKTTNSTTANNYMSKSAELAMLINSGKYPIEYEVENNRYEFTNITNNEILYFAIAILAIICVIFIIFIIKYKTKGLLCSISCIGFISVLSLILRYANVIITIEGIGAILFTIAINLMLNQVILSKTQKIDMIDEAINGTYKEIFSKLIPVIIISLVFCLSGWTNLSSFGMVMFWGIILIAIYNITITKGLLKLRENK